MEKVLTNNQILKNMVQRVYKNGRKSFVQLLHVNVETCEPKDVTNCKYSKEWKENFFYFLNSSFRIIVVLKGSDWQEKYKSYGEYPDGTPWNRKNIEPMSTYVLMITPEMRKEYRQNCLSTVSRINRFKEKEALQKRLDSYKTNKNQEISYDQMKVIIKDMMSFFTENIFEDSNFARQFNSLNSFDYTVTGIIRNFADDAGKYISNYTGFENEKKKYGNETGWDLSWSSYYKDCLKYKNRILDWKLIVNKITEMKKVAI